MPSNVKILAERIHEAHCRILDAKHATMDHVGTAGVGLRELKDHMRSYAEHCEAIAAELEEMESTERLLESLESFGL